VNLSLSWTLLLRFHEPFTAGPGDHKDLALLSSQQLSSIPVPIIWEEIKAWKREHTANKVFTTLSSSSLQSQCNTVWFQVRKLAAFCSGDSHCHHPKKDKQDICCVSEIPRKTAAEKTVQPVHLVWTKSIYNHFGWSLRCRWCKCSRPAGTSQPSTTLGN